MEKLYCLYGWTVIIFFFDFDKQDKCFLTTDWHQNKSVGVLDSKISYLLTSVKWKCSNWERKFWHDSPFFKKRENNIIRIRLPNFPHPFSCIPSEQQSTIYLDLCFIFLEDLYKGSNLNQWSILTSAWVFSVCHFNFWLFYSFCILKIAFSFSIFNLCYHYKFYISFSTIGFSSFVVFNYKNHLALIFYFSLKFSSSECHDYLFPFLNVWVVLIFPIFPTPPSM